MRGQSVVTGTLFPEQVNGYVREEDVRLPYDQARARALLAEAGYPNGFSVTLDCSNNRYINDEQICQPSPPVGWGPLSWGVAGDGRGAGALGRRQGRQRQPGCLGKLPTAAGTSRQSTECVGWASPKLEATSYSCATVAGWRSREGSRPG
jgi:hypothetical protein